MSSPRNQAAVALLLAAALFGYAAVQARRTHAENQAAYDAWVRTGVAPAAPPAVSGATLAVQERL